MPPQENAFSPFAEIAKRDLSFADSRFERSPAPIFLPAPVGPLGELPDRRLFLKTLALPCAAACAMALTRNSFALNPATWGAGSEDDSRYRVEARFYEKLPDKMVRCKLCPRECVVAPGSRGYCRVRENRNGTYYTLVHSRIVSAHIDPLEKKPFFHFLPGTPAFSVATAGCNVNCKFCQNWEISQARPEQVRASYLPPQKLAEPARQDQCPTIAYPDSEPVIYYEYLMDAAPAGHALGVKSVVVTGGYISQ